MRLSCAARSPGGSGASEPKVKHRFDFDKSNCCCWFSVVGLYLSTVKHFKLLGVVKGLVGILFGFGVFLKGGFGHLANSADHLGDLFERRAEGRDVMQRKTCRQKTPQSKFGVLRRLKNVENKAACVLELHQRR